MTYESHRVSVPEGTKGPWTIDRFTIEKDDLRALMYALEGRSPGLGTFTRLCRNGSVWMSDTDAEVRDHFEAIWKLRTAESALIHGLGLGVVVQAALRSETVREVTVVEIDEDVLALVGPHYSEMAQRAGKSLVLLHDDALTWQPPPRAHWDVVWHDIWRDLTVENRPEMTRLSRRFGSRSGWQGCWGRAYLDAHRRWL